MSISTEIIRLQTARNSIRNKLVAMGLAENTDSINDLATAIDGIVNQGSISATVQEGNTYTVPEGYHDGTGTVTGVGNGITYDLQSKSVTPSTNAQTVTPSDGYYGLSEVVVNPIPSVYKDVSSVTALGSDVLANKVFVTSTGQIVAGTMPNNGSLSSTFDGITTGSVNIPAGYTSGGTIALDNSIENSLKAI